MTNLKNKIAKEKNRILLVEDEPTNMAILSSYLQDGGYSVDEATDGRDAWELLLKNGDYGVVITDRRMPNMDGLELAHKIKAEPEFRGIPIIMQTSATTLAEVSEGIKAGVYYYLAKPYEEETILTLTKSALREREKTSNFEQKLFRQKDALGTIMNGEFHIKTPEEAENLAFTLGSLLPRPELAVSGLYELLMNAIEHGNLQIGYDTKGKLLSESSLESEIQNRLKIPENDNKKVVVQFMRKDREVNIKIIDQGEGFDWRPFLEIEPSRATQGNGRGIAKANLISFDKLTYSPKGNEVVVASAIS